MKRFLLLFSIAAGAATALAQETNFDTVKVRSQKLTENIYLLTGSGGNIGVLTGPDGVLMVDDQFGELSEKIKTAVQSLDPGPVKFVINTHIHGDHSGGNENFKRLGATLVAHDHVREHMLTGGTSKAAKPRDKDALPVVTFATKMSFHLNGQDIDAHHFGKGHTDGDIVIHFKNANVFHTGDLYVRYGYPFIDITEGGGINGFIENLDKMLSLMDDQSKVIPGHGELATKKDVKIFRDKMKDIRDNVAAALKAGTKPADIPAMGITDKFDAEWGKGFLKGRDFVLMVVENLSAK